MKANAIFWIMVIFAMPVMAAVNFTATDVGNGRLQIAYTTTDGDLPRGVALRISLSNGATVDMHANPVAIVDPAFNTFIDYAYSNPLNYAVGAGHPLAKATEAGALVADASDFSICMGVLDQMGSQLPGPASTTNLITIQLKDFRCPTIITINGDTLRGPVSGVVGSVLASNLPITVEMWNMCGSCLKSSAPEYPDWVAWGMPTCWCYQYQCRGDINGTSFGGRPVSTADLNIFKAAFNKTDTELRLVTNGICADLNHASFGGRRVTTVDLNILKFYFNKRLADVPSCDMDNFNYWITP